MTILITLAGFEDAAIKNATEKQLKVLIEDHSFRLSTVEQVTVAADYTRFLLDFDTGFRPREVISATEGDNEGVGLPPEVLRNGVDRRQLLVPVNDNYFSL